MKNPNRVPPLVRLPLSAQANGIRISGGSGSGKSILGGWIAFQNFRQGIPTVILDPHGGTIDFFLANVWKWCRNGQLNKDEQQQLWQRIKYADMSGKSGRVTTFPLFYRLGNESLHEIAQRLVSTIARLDPALKSASIEGFNALDSILTPAGMIMAALDWQVTEIADLLHSQGVKPWKARFEEAVDRYPEAQAAVDFFKKEYFQWKMEARFRKIGSLMVKLNMFRYSPAMRATYGASRASLDWLEAIDQSDTDCLDFRHVLNAEQRRFGLDWCLHSFEESIKHRGKGRHNKSVALIIDELSEFGQLQAETDSSIFSEDLNYLINILKRQYRILLTIIHQEAYQLDPKTRKTLLSMGTQILGVSHDEESALEMARQFIPYQPRLKRTEPVFAASAEGPLVVHERPVEYTLEEQRALAAQAFTQLGRFKFLVKLSKSEGETTGRFVPMSIEPLIGQWVEDTTIEKIRHLLAQRDGQPIDQVLTEIKDRGQQIKQLGQRTEQSVANSDTLKTDDSDKELSDDDFYYE